MGQLEAQFRIDIVLPHCDNNNNGRQDNMEDLPGETANLGKRTFKMWNANIRFLRRPVSGSLGDKTKGQSV
jgi:hypothetical protein